MDNLFPPSLQLNINNIFQVGSVLFGNMLTFQIPSFAISKNSYFYRIMTVFPIDCFNGIFQSFQPVPVNLIKEIGLYC